MPASQRSQYTFASSLSTVSQAARTLISEGLSILPRLGDAQRRTLVQLAMDTFSAPDIEDSKKAAEILGVNEREAAGVIGSASFLMGSAAAPDTPEEIADALQKEQLIAPEYKRDVILLLRELRLRSPDIGRILQERALGDAVLPSYRSIETTIDIRINFRTATERIAVPVAIALLITDATNQRLWFQLSAAQLRSLIKDLQSTLTLMEQADSWVQQSRTK